MKDYLIALLLLVFVAVTAKDAEATSRSPSTVYQFKKVNKCPATGVAGQHACPGWVINHIVPLSCGGLDVVENMEWEEKAASYKRDVFERAICKGKN